MKFMAPNASVKHRVSRSFRELTLREMLDDPLVQDVMRSDGVSRAEIEFLFSHRAPLMGIAA